MRRSLASCALGWIAACAVGCEPPASDTRGSVEWCEDLAPDLVPDGEPAFFDLPAAHGIAGCGRGDPSTELVVRVPPSAGALETIVEARSAAGDPIVLAIERACGDPSRSLGCVEEPDSDGASRLVERRSFATSGFYVAVRSRTGRATRVAISLHRRALLPMGAPCAPEPDGCLLDPACASTDACGYGGACIDGRCRDPVSREGQPCDDQHECHAALVCDAGTCASPIGLACDLGPAYCARVHGLACIDGVCASSIAQVGERCVPDDLPSCDGRLVCTGELGAERCADVFGIECVERTTLPVSRATAPLEPLAFTIDPAARSTHSDGCLLGRDTPERVFTIEGTGAAVRLEARRADGTIAPMHLRGPGTCEAELRCSTARDVTVYPTAPIFAIVEGTGDHTISAREGRAVAVGARCGADPWTFCDAELACDDGVCSEVFFTVAGGRCFCEAAVLGDPTLAVQHVVATMLPGQVRWAQVTSRVAPSGLRITPGEVCPTDLRVEVFPERSDCPVCEPPATERLADLAIGDGTTCIERDVAPLPVPAPPANGYRLRISSVIGGDVDLEIDTF